MVGDNTDHVANREIIGDLTVGGGSEVVVRHVDNNARYATELQVANIFRSGTGRATILLSKAAAWSAVPTNRVPAPRSPAATAPRSDSGAPK